MFVDGEERTGYILYGLWPEASAPSEQLDEQVLGVGAEVARPFRLFGEGWNILGIDCAFADDLQYRQALDRIEGQLDAIIAAGARVAWMGSEGLPFADPPDLFTQEWMEDGVLVGKTRESDLMSGIAPEGFMPLADHQMRVLEQAARRTYDAP
ncbi:hypothetical protein ACFVDI_01795 [Nocardioides sp. NPDC057767]|uniref:hypothetical protein n=1 Tax=unclassified Nocardioides TaxID=2615069 RepID=UPI00366FE9C6